MFLLVALVLLILFGLRHNASCKYPKYTRGAVGPTAAGDMGGFEVTRKSDRIIPFVGIVCLVVRCLRVLLLL